MRQVGLLSRSDQVNPSLLTCIRQFTLNKAIDHIHFSYWNLDSGPSDRGGGLQYLPGLSSQIFIQIKSLLSKVDLIKNTWNAKWSMSSSKDWWWLILLHLLYHRYFPDWGWFRLIYWPENGDLDDLDRLKDLDFRFFEAKGSTLRPVARSSPFNVVNFIFFEFEDIFLEIILCKDILF